MEIAKNRKGQIEVEINSFEDKVQAYLIGHYEFDDFTESEKVRYNRLQSIRNLTLTHFSANQAIEAHVNLLKEAGIEISKRTAWIDYKTSMELWGKSYAISYHSKLVTYEEFVLKALNLAFKEKHTKSIPSLIKELTDIAKTLNELDATKNKDMKVNSFVLNVKYVESDQEVTFDLNTFETLKSEEQEEILLKSMESLNISDVEFKKLMYK